jgi:hypothetical protein
MKVTMPCFLLLSRDVFMNNIFLCESDITKQHTYCWKRQLSFSSWCGTDFHLLATKTLEKHHTNYIRSHRYDRCTASWCNWWMFGLCKIICVCIWTCLMKDLMENTWRKHEMYSILLSVYRRMCHSVGDCIVEWTTLM